MVYQSYLRHTVTTCGKVCKETIFYNIVLTNHLSRFDHKFAVLNK